MYIKKCILKNWQVMYFLIAVPQMFAATSVVATLVVVVPAEAIAAEVVAFVAVAHVAIPAVGAAAAEIAALNYKYWIGILPLLLGTFSLFI